MDGHPDTMAVASGAQDPGAEVPARGTLGTRPCASDHLPRQRPSNAPPRIFVSAAGPCGSWRSRYRRTTDDDGWVAAPSRRPTQAGARVKTDRREALPLARRARAGARTRVSGPQGHAAALRALPRARDEARRARQDAPCRRNALVRRHDLRSTGRAQGARPTCGGALQWSGPRPRHTGVFPQTAAQGRSRPHAANGSSTTATSPGPPGVGPRWSRLCRPGAACHARGPSPCEQPGGPGRGVIPPETCGHAGACPPQHPPPGRTAARGRCPTPAPPRPDACSPKAPGPLAIPRQSAALCHGAAQPHPPPSRTAVGKRPCGGVTVPGASWHEAHTPRGCPWPWPGRWRGAGGLVPEWSPSYRQPAREGRCHPARSRVPHGHQHRRRPGGGYPSTAFRGGDRPREPRPRPAPDGGQEGGSPPTESSRINRRV